MARRRLSAFIFITLLLNVLDAGITDYLLKNFDEDGEINPFVYTESFFTILFSPAPAVTMALYVLCVIYAEKNHERLQDLINERSMKVGLFVFTLFFPLSKLMIVLNNLFPLFGRTTPVVWISAPFEAWTDSPFMQLVFAETFLAILAFPVLLYCTKRIYLVKQHVHQS